MFRDCRITRRAAPCGAGRAPRGGVQRTSLRLLAGLFASFLIGQTAYAESSENRLSFIDHCLAQTELDALEAALIGTGWSGGSDARDTLIDGLGWIGASQYFVGDSGGERVETVLELKTKSAGGLLRKVDIPQSKNRYMVRGSGGGREVLHVMWRQPVQTVTEVECRAALLPVSLTEIRAQIGAQDLPAFAPMKTVKVDDGTLNITLLNSDALAPLTPPDAIVTTYRIVKTDKVTP